MDEKSTHNNYSGTVMNKVLGMTLVILFLCLWLPFVAVGMTMYGIGILGKKFLFAIGIKV
jgi:hypothetical protein